MKLFNKSTFKQSWLAVKYVLKREKAGRKYTFFKTIDAILGAVAPLVAVIFPGKIINELSGEIVSYQKLTLYVLSIAAIPFLWYVLHHLLKIKTTSLASEFNIHSNELVLNHLAKIDFEVLELPETQQLRERAGSAMGRLLAVIDIYCNFLGSMVGFISICSIISLINLLIVVLVIMLVLLNSFAAKWLQRKNRESRLNADILNRKKMAYCYAFDSLWFAKEMRLFQSQNFLIKQMSENEKLTNKNDIEYTKKEGVANVVPVLTSMLQKIIVYAYLIYLVIKNGLPIGTMTIYVSAVASLYNSINNLSQSYLSLTNMQYDWSDVNGYFAIKLRQFNSGKQNSPKAINSIEFINVSFRYPGSERFALKNINLTISMNEKLCIVGENGAGKSTFINLLTRMYFPSDGEILLNGKSIYEYDYSEYIKLFAPVFQDFCKYEFELRNNVCLSNDIDEKKLKDALVASSISSLVEKLPKKENTFIGKWVDPEGFEPSGGEAQKIAIARALYHGGEIYILDEPTAALDPNAEYEIYTQFSDMIKDKTAILVTHRLSAVQLADKVAVFDNGHVAEYGTHTELYAKGGIYTEMFDKQAKFYRDSPDQTEKTDE